MYVLANLGKGVPDDACFKTTVTELRKKTFRRMFNIPSDQQMSQMMGNLQQLQTRQQQFLEMVGNFQRARLQRKQRELIEDQMTATALDSHERQLVAQLFQRSNISQFIGKLAEEQPDLIRQQLKSNDPLARLLVLLMISQRRLHLEKELIACLNDPHPALREVAHKALVRVARGTDFGPLPGFSQSGIAHSTEKWRHWLALQSGESSKTVAPIAGAATAKPGNLDPDKALKFLLDHGNRELQTVPPAVTQLCDDLVKAKGDEQMSILARLRDAKGIDNTDALALAIPKLSAGAAQREARDALAQRLTRMTAKTLRDKLQDDSVEVRRAAALACGRKKADEHIPDLLQLLDDPEVAVIQAARKALMELTGEDFGPTEEAGRKGRASAAADWRKWYEEHPRESK
ncbi:MAG TPA: HEAT repeat domain-containing protein [Gemmataceae bacterium]